jgi:hypothetical protein
MSRNISIIPHKIKRAPQSIESRLAESRISRHARRATGLFDSVLATGDEPISLTRAFQMGEIPLRLQRKAHKLIPTSYQKDKHGNIRLVTNYNEQYTEVHPWQHIVDRSVAEVHEGLDRAACVLKVAQFGLHTTTQVNFILDNVTTKPENPALSLAPLSATSVHIMATVTK